MGDPPPRLALVVARRINRRKAKIGELAPQSVVVGDEHILGFYVAVHDVSRVYVGDGRDEGLEDALAEVILAQIISFLFKQRSCVGGADAGAGAGRSGGGVAAVQEVVVVLCCATIVKRAEEIPPGAVLEHEVDVTLDVFERAVEGDDGGVEERGVHVDFVLYLSQLEVRLDFRNLDLFDRHHEPSRHVPGEVQRGASAVR